MSECSQRDLTANSWERVQGIGNINPTNDPLTPALSPKCFATKLY